MSRETRRRVSAGALATIDPASLSNLELYLRADQVTGVEGDRVSSWPDLSTNARTATQATGAAQPVLRKTTNLSPKGKALVEFDTAPREMNGTLPGTPLTSARGFMIYTAFNLLSVDGGATNAQVPFYCPTGSVLGVFANANVAFGFATNGHYGWEVNTRVATATNTATGWQLLTLACAAPSGGVVTLYLNGTSIGAGTWVAAPSTAYRVGGFAGSGGLRGGLGSVIFFTDTHNDATRTGVEAFLTNFF